MLRVERFEGKGERTVLAGRRRFRGRRRLSGRGMWRRIRCFLRELETKPGVELQGRRTDADAFILRDKVQDVPALLAAEAVPGIFRKIHLELARRLAFAERASAGEVLTFAGEALVESVAEQYRLQ